MDLLYNASTVVFAKLLKKLAWESTTNTSFSRAGGRTGLAGQAGAGCLSGPAGLGGKIYGITSLRITCNLWDIRLQSTVSLPIQARSTDYSKMSSKSAAATNSFLVLNEPTKKVQDYKQMKPNGAVSCVWDHFSVYDPKYNRKSQAVCNHCFLKYTKDPDGKIIDGDCAKIHYKVASVFKFF